MRKDKLDFIEFMDFIGNKVPTVADYDMWVESKTKKAKITIDWINEWLDLWPEGVKSGGKYLRSDARSCEKKMITFLKNYPEYSKEIIFRATEMYLDSKHEDNWNYTRCAVYFIDKKDEGSQLADGCNYILHSRMFSTESNKRTQDI